MTIRRNFCSSLAQSANSLRCLQPKDGQLRRKSIDAFCQKQYVALSYIWDPSEHEDKELGQYNIENWDNHCLKPSRSENAPSNASSATCAAKMSTFSALMRIKRDALQAMDLVYQLSATPRGGAGPAAEVQAPASVGLCMDVQENHRGLPRMQLLILHDPSLEADKLRRGCAGRCAEGGLSPDASQPDQPRVAGSWEVYASSGRVKLYDPAGYKRHRDAGAIESLGSTSSRRQLLPVSHTTGWRSTQPASPLRELMFQGFRALEDDNRRLTFVKGCRFTNVELAAGGIATKGHPWKLGHVIDTAKFRRELPWIREPDGRLKLKDQQRLQQLVDYLDGEGFRTLTKRIDEYLALRWRRNATGRRFQVWVWAIRRRERGTELARGAKDVGDRAGDRFDAHKLGRWDERPPTIDYVDDVVQELLQDAWGVIWGEIYPGNTVIDKRQLFSTPF
ncbi:hypothetical protein MKZ38_004490 [Zalerion maritima]|uniref:Uncharacterized protein n=1 Tax=Zalerion maritima TaxID=339359 RepID=A0AAD5RMP9_9PEZI|nr:hypothetical protein MKZ38_004490 [Zalerion maritima]